MGLLEFELRSVLRVSDIVSTLSRNLYNASQTWR